jgi:acyl-CoA dehydrogenase
MTDPLLVQTAAEVFGRHTEPGPLWTALVGTGLAGVGVPESAGGEGGEVADAVALLRLAGEHAAPVPLAESALIAGWLLADAGLALPPGADWLTVAPGGPGDTASVSADGEVAGLLERVPCAADAGHVVALLPAGRGAPAVERPGTAGLGGPGGPGLAVVVLPRAAYHVVPGANLAGEPRDTVVVRRATPVTAAATVTAADLHRRGAATRAVLIAGALRHVLDLTTTYANDRIQFGRPISRFQAVGGLLARLAEETALAEMAAHLAAAALADPDAAVDAVIAKSVAGRAAGTAARLAHQIHGAIGVTAEYPLQRYTRRLLSWRDEYGPDPRWEAELGAALLATGSAAAWDTVTGTRLLDL